MPSTTEDLIATAIIKLKTAIDDIELAEEFATTDDRNKINSIRLSIEELTNFLTEFGG